MRDHVEEGAVRFTIGGMLMTRAGRTFWAIPKSTCQTSPRSGMARFFLVQGAERLGGERSVVVVREVSDRLGVEHDHARHPGLAAVAAPPSVRP